jgi:hypothetical protein
VYSDDGRMENKEDRCEQCASSKESQRVTFSHIVNVLYQYIFQAKFFYIKIFNIRPILIKYCKSTYLVLGLQIKMNMDFSSQCMLHIPAISYFIYTSKWHRNNIVIEGVDIRTLRPLSLCRPRLTTVLKNYEICENNL